MLLKFFKSNLPYVVILIPIVGILLWIPSLFPQISIKQVSLNETHLTPFYNLLATWTINNYYINVISALILVILQSFLLIRLNFKYIFIENKTYLPAVVFVFINSGFVFYQQLTPALLANTFVLLALDKCLVFNKERNVFKQYFETGFYIGISVLIYPIAIYLMLIVWITQFILRTFNWREWLASIIGLITPIALYLSIYFLNNSHNNIVEAYIEFLDINISIKDTLANLYNPVLFLIVGIYIIGFLSALRIIGTKKISSRKYFTIFTWILFISILIFSLLPQAGFELIYFISVPLSITFSIFLIELRKSIIAEIFFFIFFIAIIILIWI